jgi:hypothetical protein
MPAAIPSLAAEPKATDDSRGQEVVNALTTLTMKHPLRNERRTLQAKTWAIEPNSGGVYDPRA